MENREEKNMSLLEKWRKSAYETEMNEKQSSEFWGGYFKLEQEIYEKILESVDKPITGTVKALAKKFKVETLTMVGFLDGINESLKESNPLDKLEEDTKVSLEFDKENLYYNMVGAKADWLYELPQWDSLLSEEKRKELYKKQKLSTTIVKDSKIGRNDPCPCGSGKKYKKCCGANV